MALIHQFVAFAIEQNAPIPWHTLSGWMLRTDTCGAVGGDCVVPTRFVAQSVERMDVFKEPFACALRRDRRVVQINIFLAIICAQADHVAFIGRDVDELELPIEPTYCRVRLTDLLASLDGKA